VLAGPFYASGTAGPFAISSQMRDQFERLRIF
jgi:hypothetical protein